VGVGRVLELEHERVALEGGLHTSALHASPAAVNQSHFAQACRVRGVHVVFDDRGEVTRMERVQIERGFDGDNHGCPRPAAMIPVVRTAMIGVVCVG
jgi:hypothetical protein